MKALKDIKAWILGPKSDFALFVAVLILANLAAAGAFFRIDLTSRHSYSLSAASRQAVRTIEEPLSVKVFFTGNLPAPYNTVERYLKDLLIEYKGAGNRNFSYQFFDMEKDDNKDLAESYGINPIQVQEVKNDEVGLKNAYMGLAVVYADAIEPVNGLDSADGLEYKLTTTIGKVISSADALSGSTGKVTVTLYASSSLGAFKIQGYDKLNKLVKDAFDRVNLKNRGKLDYRFVDSASGADIDGLSAKFGIQKINWEKQPSGMEAGSGVLGIVLEHGDRSRTIPISLARSLFGYGIAGLDGLEQNLSDSIQGLMANSTAVGYLTGHGEKDIYDAQNGAAHFSTLVSDTYEFKELDLTKSDIPANITTLVINGPKTKLGEAELYRIDQFLMRGGSVLAMVDPFDEQMQGNAMYGGMPSYEPIDSGLGALLEKYGAKLERNYVLDSECYVAQQQGTGKVPLYYVPIIGKKGLDGKSPVSRNLSDVYFLKAGEVALSIPADAAKERTGTVLASSSAESWTMSDNITLMPYGLAKPTADKLSKHGLAVLVEGNFTSAFDSIPSAIASAQAEASGGNAGAAALNADSRLAKSVQSGKLVVIGTSEITGPALLDGTGRQPVAAFVRNALDYLAGNADLNDMRTKGLGLDPLNKTPQAVRLTAKSVNMYGLPLIAVVAGLVAWRRRIKRRAQIQAIYAAAAAKSVEN